MDEAELAEALRDLGPRAALSHHDAARLHGIEVVEDDGSHHATVPRNSARPKRQGWQVHRADVAVVTLANGLRLTNALRTVLDLCSVLPLDRAVAAADSAVRLRLITFPQLIAALRAVMGPHSTRARAVARLVDERCESVLESLVRVLLLTSGMTPPRTQHEIRDGNGRLVARVDFCWVQQRLVLEADGYAFHSDRSDFRRDRTRMNELERLGWRVLRVTWEDVMSRPDYVLALVRDCLAASDHAA